MAKANGKSKRQRIGNVTPSAALE